MSMGVGGVGSGRGSVGGGLGVVGVEAAERCGGDAFMPPKSWLSFFLSVGVASGWRCVAAELLCWSLFVASTLTGRGC